jgi:beta-N-acetylhexosaminidase
MNTIDIKTNAQSDAVARIMNKTLLDIGFRQNFAPVVDISPNNAAIKNSGFGDDKNQVISLSKQFIKTTQEQGIITTAKHFPGHGIVKGDTHKNSAYIDGNLQELEVYPPLIDTGVLSIMIAHITI